MDLPIFKALCHTVLIWIFLSPEGTMNTMIDDIRLFSRAKEMYKDALVFFQERIRKHVVRQHRCSLALAGGSTPRPLYELLSKEEIPWERVDLFWSDERCVPPDHEESNFHMAQITLLDRLKVSPASVHRMKGEISPPEKSAEGYEEEIQLWLDKRKKECGDIEGARGNQYLFDIVLLGMGKDGHTASLFPKAKTLEEDKRIITVERNPQLPPKIPRITFTLEAIRRSREVILLIKGLEKVKVIESFMGEPLKGRLRDRKTQDPHYPASMVWGMEGTYWFICRD